MFDVFDQIPPEGISPEELEKLQEQIALIQEQGRIFVEQYLIRWTLAEDSNRSYEKTLIDTDQPVGYDFTTIDNTGKRNVCVKSTKNSFKNKIHISYNELLQMREVEYYDLYRVYEINGAVAKVRIANNLKEFAITILNTMENLPDDVYPDSISLVPSILNFQSPIIIYLTEYEE